MKKMEKTYDPQVPELARSVVDFLHDVVYILAAVLLVFTFCMRVVVVSGDSMFDTLANGDYLLLLNQPLCGKLEQGDVVVASMERFEQGEPIVKRVIATAGQTVDIDFEAGVVYVDGVALEEPYAFTPTNIQEGTRFPLTVAEGCVLLMGDNRNESRDSRDPGIGQVDQRDVLGKAILLLVPGTGTRKHPMAFDLGRLGFLEAS